MRTDAAAILGAHVEGIQRGDEAPVQAAGRDRRAGRRRARRFAPSGAAIEPGGGIRRLDASGQRPSAGCPGGRVMAGAARAGRRARDRRTAAARQPTISSPRSRCCCRRTAPTSAAPRVRRAGGEPGPRRSRARHRAGRDGRAGGGLRRAEWRHRAGAGRRGAARYPARGANLRRCGHPGYWVDSSAAGPSAPSAGSQARSPRPSSWAMPTRAMMASWATAWWAIGSTSAPCTTTSNLKNTYGPVRLEVEACGSRPAG